MLEWANIGLLTRRKDWSESQRRMMRRAARVHGLRGLGLAILIALVTWGSLEGYGSLQAAHLIDSLRTANHPGCPGPDRTAPDLPPVGRPSPGGIAGEHGE